MRLTPYLAASGEPDAEDLRGVAHAPGACWYSCYFIVSLDNCRRRGPDPDAGIFLNSQTWCEAKAPAFGGKSSHGPKPPNRLFLSPLPSPLQDRPGADGARLGLPDAALRRLRPAVARDRGRQRCKILPGKPRD